MADDVDSQRSFVNSDKNNASRNGMEYIEDTSNSRADDRFSPEYS